VRSGCLSLALDQNRKDTRAEARCAVQVIDVRNGDAVKNESIEPILAQLPARLFPCVARASEPAILAAQGYKILLHENRFHAGRIDTGTAPEAVRLDAAAMFSKGSV
jgi:hypothetical protein